MDELSQPQSLDRYQSKLSAAVKDAMSVVSALGERYLWVDTLCIIQDDPVQKQIQIAQMATIYNGALLTILAAGGTDANTPLHGVRPNTRRLHPSFSKDGVTILASDGGLDLKKHTYGTRGWTYQEMILSQRRLYITGQIALFECQVSWHSEDTPEGRSMDGVGSSDGSSIPDQNSLESYAAIVENYTRRRLTYYTDRLNACTGILVALQTSWKWEFQFGLPEERFVQALLWSGQDQSCLGNSSGNTKSDFPSWSWLQGAGARVYPFGDAVEEIGHYEILKWSSRVFDISILKNGNWHEILNKETKAADDIQDTVDLASLSSTHNLDHMLRFSAETQSYQEYRLQENDEHIELEEKIGSEINGQPLTHLYDADGAWCGLVLGIPRSQLESEQTTSKIEFVLISSYYASNSWAAEVLNVSFWDDPLTTCYDDEIFEGGEDDTVNALVVKWSGEVATRIAVAEIHKDAWAKVHSVKKTIYLV